MPEISRFLGVVIKMYFEDHPLLFRNHRPVSIVG
jgi:hypothetical protein